MVLFPRQEAGRRAYVFFSSRRRHTRSLRDWSSDVCSSDLFLCASTLESARILLNSGIANSSGQLGKNVMDHIMGGGANGRIDAPADKIEFGTRPNGIYVPRFRNVTEKSKDFVRGYGFQGGAGRGSWGRGSDMMGFGADFKRELRKPGPWGFGFYGFGEMLPRPENYCEIDKTKVDAWGIPALRISCAYGENEHKLLADMAVTAAEMLAAAGAHEIEPFTSDNPPGLVIHETRTARAWRRPRARIHPLPTWRSRRARPRSPWTR